MIGFVRRGILHVVEYLFFGGRTGLDNADEALRYLPIAEEILGEPRQPAAILEVGSGARGIAPYLPLQITGADLAFHWNIAPNLQPVKLTGTTLPFADDSYDCVISVDMLEHVPVPLRREVVRELLRVTRQRLYLAVPCGAEAEAHDRELDDFYLEKRGERYPFLSEHVENGLPCPEEVTAALQAAAEALGKRVGVTVRPNLNLRVRSFLMKLWIGRRKPTLYAWLSPFFCIFHRRLNAAPCYRLIYRIDVEAKRT